MLERTRIGVVVAASLLAGGIATAWTLRGDLVTQAQLTAAVVSMDSKLGPIATQVEKVADRVADIDKRLSRLEGKLDSSPR